MIRQIMGCKNPSGRPSPAQMSLEAYHKTSSVASNRTITGSKGCMLIQLCCGEQTFPFLEIFVLLSIFFVFPSTVRLSVLLFLQFIPFLGTLFLPSLSSGVPVQKCSSQSLKSAVGMVSSKLGQMGDKIGCRHDATSEISLDNLPGRKIIFCQNLTEQCFCSQIIKITSLP